MVDWDVIIYIVIIYIYIHYTVIHYRVIILYSVIIYIYIHKGIQINITINSPINNIHHIPTNTPSSYP